MPAYMASLPLDANVLFDDGSDGIENAVRGTGLDRDITRAIWPMVVRHARGFLTTISTDCLLDRSDKSDF